MSTLRDIIADINDQASSTAKYTSNLFKFTVNGKPAGIYAVTGMTLVLVGSMIYINKDNEGKDTSFMGTFFPGFGSNAKKDEESPEEGEKQEEEEEETPEESPEEPQEEGNKGEESPVEEEPQEEEKQEPQEGDKGEEPPVEEEGDKAAEPPVEEEPKEEGDNEGEPPVEEKPPERYGGKTRKRKIKKKNYTISRRR